MTEDLSRRLREQEIINLYASQDNNYSTNIVTFSPLIIHEHTELMDDIDALLTHPATTHITKQALREAINDIAQQYYQRLEKK